MKKIIPYLAILAFAINGCKKNNATDTPPAALPKKHTCTRSFSSSPPGLAFSGFTAGQISRVIISKYTANTGWSSLIGQETLDIPMPYFEQDTAYAREPHKAEDGFLLLQLGIDYKIQIPATAQEYTITEITKRPDSETWEQDSPCSPGSGQTVWITYDLKINGQAMAAMGPMFFSMGQYMYFIQH